MGAAAILSETAIINDHVRAFSDKDWEAWKRALTPDATYREFGSNTMAIGPDQMVAAVKKWADAFADLRGNVTKSVAEGNTVMAEIIWYGTHTGDLQGPMGAIPATGKWGEVHAVEVFVFEGEKIREVRHYFDSIELLRGLGMIPA